MFNATFNLSGAVMHLLSKLQDKDSVSQAQEWYLVGDFQKECTDFRTSKRFNNLYEFPE